MILLSWVRFIPWYDIGNIITGAACGAGNAYLSGVPVVLSSVSPYFMWLSCLLVFYLRLFDCLVSTFVTFMIWSFLKFQYCKYCYVVLHSLKLCKSIIYICLTLSCLQYNLKIGQKIPENSGKYRLFTKFK